MSAKHNFLIAETEALLTVAQDRLTEMVVLGKANFEIQITGDNALLLYTLFL